LWPSLATHQQQRSTNGKGCQIYTGWQSLLFEDGHLDSTV